ncbi:MAG TPA: aspartate 1-decarboxylase [Silvibacterium sp.]|nr:aspartate 1-decarboxylase [Silvibacterium sp.]
MLIKLMKAKIHRATVTQSDLHYEGSIGIDEYLLDQSGILPFEAVHVWNLNNATRFETYAIPLKRHSGEICINGAAARLAQPGDLVIVASFCWMDDGEAHAHKPTVVLVDAKNRVSPLKPE